MPLRTDFGTFRQPIDPTEGAQGALALLQKELGNYQNRQDLLKQQAVENAKAQQLMDIRQGTYDRLMAEKQAQDLASSMYSDVTPNRILTQKGTTTTTPAVQGVLPTNAGDINAQIGASADKVAQIEAMLKGGKQSGDERFSQPDLRSVLGMGAAPAQVADTAPYADPTYPYVGNSRSMNAFVTNQPTAPLLSDYNGMVLTPQEKQQAANNYRVGLEQQRQAELGKIDSLTQNLVNAYNAGARPATTTTTPDKYEYKAPSREQFLKDLEVQAIAANDGKPLTKIQKGALGKRAEELFQRSEDMAYKNTLLGAQYGGKNKETAYQKEKGKLQAQLEAGVIKKADAKKDPVAEALFGLNANNWLYKDRKNASKAVLNARGQGVSDTKIAAALRAATDEDKDFNLALFNEYLQGTN